MKNGFFGARGGQHLCLGIERDTQAALGPASDCLTQTPLSNHGRVLRHRIQRVDQRLTDKGRRRLDGIANPEVENGHPAPRQVLFGLIQKHCEVRRWRGGHRAHGNAWSCPIRSVLRTIRAISTTGPRWNKWPFGSTLTERSPPCIRAVTSESTR